MKIKSHYLSKRLVYRLNTRHRTFLHTIRQKYFSFYAILHIPQRLQIVIKTKIKNFQFVDIYRLLTNDWHRCGL